MCIDGIHILFVRTQRMPHAERNLRISWHSKGRLSLKKKALQEWDAMALKTMQRLASGSRLECCSCAVPHYGLCLRIRQAQLLIFSIVRP